MTVVPVFLDIISDDIIKKIDTGEYKRIGGVVRDNKGQIVTLPRDATMTKVILHYAWNNRDTLIKVGKGGYKLARLYSDSKKKQQPVVKFRKAFKVYLDAVCKGTLTMELISDVMERFDEVKRIHEKINIPLSMEEIDMLMNGMFEYTKILASDNGVELTSLEKETPSRSVNPIINLQCFLETQKRIFELAS
ncbi:MAG: hypothetical protein ACE3L7_02280 [Candidatus Pristimantibacillus sp.]